MIKRTKKQVLWSNKTQELIIGEARDVGANTGKKYTSEQSLTQSITMTELEIKFPPVCLQVLVASLV